MSYRLPDEAALALMTAADEVRAGRFDHRARGQGLDPFAVMGVDADAVPPELMPDWMAQLIAALGSALDRRHWAQFLDSLAWAGQEWRALDEAAWTRVRMGFQAQAVGHALAFATPLQPDPAPRYWREIAPLAHALLAAFSSDGDVRGAAAELECWSIPEGYDLWAQENATYEAEWAAKCLADAGFGAGQNDAWTEGGMVDHITAGDSSAGQPLSRALFQQLSIAISAAKWG